MKSFLCRALIPSTSALLLVGCAFPTQVQRVAIEYNETVADVANEVTLLNVVRAYEGLPLHYTSVSSLRGNVTFKAGGGINSALRPDGTTATDQVVATDATQVAPAGTTTTATTATTQITQVAEGVSVTTPTISAEVTTGPNFDVAVLDTQKFYNGILAAIPLSTVENYLGQRSFDEQLVIRLLVERVDIRYLDPASNATRTISWVNEPGTKSEADFAKAMACYQLKGVDQKANPVSLVPVSRIRRNDSSSLVGLTLQEVALLDGKSLDLSKPIGPDPAGDADVVVQRPGASRRVAELIPDPDILADSPEQLPLARRKDWEICKEVRNAVRGTGSRLPDSPPPDPVFIGSGQVLALAEDKKREVAVSAEMSMVFRSTESVVRYVGRYLRANNPALLGGLPVFAVSRGRVQKPLVSCELLGQRYSIADDERRFRNMQVIAIIQQLINLHKESSERPQTVPVRVVGG